MRDSSLLPVDAQNPESVIFEISDTVLRTGVPELEFSARKKRDQKGGLGLGPWARYRVGPGPARTSYLHGST